MRPGTALQVPTFMPIPTTSSTLRSDACTAQHGPAPPASIVTGTPKASWLWWHVGDAVLVASTRSTLQLFPCSETDHPISATPLLLPQKMPQASSCHPKSRASPCPHWAWHSRGTSQSCCWPHGEGTPLLCCRTPLPAALPPAQLAPRTPSRRRKAPSGPTASAAGGHEAAHTKHHLLRAPGPSSQGAERGLHQKAGRRPLQQQPQGERALPLGPPGAVSSGNLNGCWSPCLWDFIFIIFFCFSLQEKPRVLPNRGCTREGALLASLPAGRAHARH